MMQPFSLGTMPRLPRRLLILFGPPVLVLSLLLLAGETSRAESGKIIKLPSSGVTPKNGLTMTVDYRGVEAPGYRPVRVTITPLTPPTADRQLRVNLRPSVFYGLPDLMVSQVIEIPEGSRGISQTVYVPQCSPWQDLTIETRESGELLDDLSYRVGRTYNRARAEDAFELVPSILFLDADADTYRSGATPPPGVGDGMIPDPTVVWNTALGQSPSQLPLIQRQEVLLPAQNDLKMLRFQAASVLQISSCSEKAESWLDFSAFDMTVISFADLKQMAQDNPAQLRRLLDWLSTGPVLCVYGVEQDFSKLADLEKLLGLPPLAEAPGGFHGWTPPDPEKYTLPVSLAAQAGFPINSEEVLTTSPGTADEASPNQAIGNLPTGTWTTPSPPTQNVYLFKAPAQPPFVGRPFQLGHVFAISSPNPFPGKPQDWSWLWNSTPTERERWTRRHGISLVRNNHDFGNWLVPGAGMAPVFSFLVIATLFALFIGPVNLAVLRRWQRQYLMLVTVPVGAALVTLLLIFYALWSDGLGVKARVRSFTDIDQPSGRVASWSRQTYYASLVPSSGLRYPADTTVFPLVRAPQSESSPRDDLPDRRMEWNQPASQSLRGGFLQSRTPSQFMVVRAGVTEARLIVTAGATPAAPPNVTNQLDCRVKYLALKTSDGQIFVNNGLASGASAALTASDPGAAQLELNRFYTSNHPEVPPGYDDNETASYGFGGGLFRSRYRGYPQPTYSSTDAAQLRTSILETSLAEMQSRGGLRNGTYLAIVEAPPDVPMGAPATQNGSLHLIRGRW